MGFAQADFRRIDDGREALQRQHAAGPPGPGLLGVVREQADLDATPNQVLDQRSHLGAHPLTGGKAVGEATDIDMYTQPCLDVATRELEVLTH